ncbi:MAG: UDP-3-O-acyl-N-acetylglucosamine deacetylase, partial [Catenulispora sp.]
MSDRQTTFSREATFEGPGLFSGETSRITFAPAAPDSGITFVREQDGKVASIPALVQNVLKRPRRTCLRNGTLFVETVEHCMAALAGMGVCNAVVRVTGGHIGELPGGDGSSRPFVEAIQEAGIAEQDAPLDPLIIRKPIQVTAEGETLAALPGPSDRLEVLYDFEAPAPVGRQIYSFHLGNDDFVTQLAPARTFIFEHEARELRSRGLGKHLSPKELLVISPDGPIENDFRFVDECARHKVLD